MFRFELQVGGRIAAYAGPVCLAFSLTPHDPKCWILFESSSRAPNEFGSLLAIAYCAAKAIRASYFVDED